MAKANEADVIDGRDGTQKVIPSYTSPPALCSTPVYICSRDPRLLTMKMIINSANDLHNYISLNILSGINYLVPP